MEMLYWLERWCRESGNEFWEDLCKLRNIRGPSMACNIAIWWSRSPILKSGVYDFSSICFEAPSPCGQHDLVFPKEGHEYRSELFAQLLISLNFIGTQSPV